MKQTQLYSKRQPEPVCQPELVEGSLSLARPELPKGRRPVILSLACPELVEGS
jgi:hypothetical protein